MNNDIKVIADNLIAEFKGLIDFQRIDDKGESFKLSFAKNEVNIIFSCSLHHLDVPWQITSQIFRNNIFQGSLEKFIDNKYTYDNPIYEITPLFLADLSANIHKLTSKIKNDLLRYLNYLEVG